MALVVVMAEVELSRKVGGGWLFQGFIGFMVDVGSSSDGWLLSVISFLLND